MILSINDITNNKTFDLNDKKINSFQSKVEQIILLKSNCDFY